MKNELTDEILEITIQKAIKWINRYGSVDIDKDAHLRILWLALKGLHCKTMHLCPAQKHSLLEHLRSQKNITDPYLLQFMKDHEEK